MSFLHTRMGTFRMTKPAALEGSSALPQSVAIPLTRAAIFLVVTAKPGAGNRGAIRSFCADLAALVRSVGFRELEGSLSCVLGFGLKHGTVSSGSLGQ